MTIETVKDIAAVLGCILSSTAVLSLISKNIRDGISRLFHTYGKDDELKEEIGKIKTMLAEHIADDKVFKETTLAANKVNEEFMRTQCRNVIKMIFYKYKDAKVLPLYEKKTLIHIEELYVGKLHGNSFASLLLKEMEGWQVDYENAREDELSD